MEDNEVSRRMRYYIAQIGISVRNCANTIGVSQRTFDANVKGVYPSIPTIKAFANHFGLSLNWLINGVEPVMVADIKPAYHVAYNNDQQRTNPSKTEPQVNDTYNINIGHSTQTVEQLTEQPKQQPAPAISEDTALLVKQLIEQNHQLYEQNVLLMDQNRSLSEQLIKLINK